MRSITRAATVAGLTLVTAPAGEVAVSDIIKTCGNKYSGYIRRLGKDALCLRPGTRTGANFPYYGGVVKTVAR
ncbi:hypothetical protein SAMN05216266_12447 [Amycolatopsis marina]|uniref:Uncharacterized protein n=1 Tax=Amycolatopsis marina TaxID=490629 RepID=A0A1I1CC97_9PSEU|nr:hypothetical protein [Amycolatopsis marina]SFB59742.1 hypothetical protein SAMN05216266_12447 [Amycolatopsis marina]